MSLNQQKRTKSLFLGTDEMDAISAIARRSYWERMWIIQEIQQATNLLIQCGERTASIRTFVDVGRILKNSPSRRAEEVWTSFAFTLLFEREKYRRTGSRSLLCWWLFWCIKCNCKRFEPIHAVYALIGIAADRAYEEIMADYSKGAQEVYKNVLRHQSFRFGDWTRNSTCVAHSVSFWEGLEVDLATRLGLVNVEGVDSNLFIGTNSAPRTLSH